MSYAAGMNLNRLDACGTGSSYLVANETEQGVSIKDRGLLYDRKASVYESCYWVISGEDYSWPSWLSWLSSDLNVIFNDIENGSVYLFTGSDRRNVTTLIESNQTAAVSKSYSVPVNQDSLVIVF